MRRFSLLALLVLASVPLFGKMTPPIEVRLSADESQVRAGGTVQITGTLLPRVNTGLVALSVETEGPVVVESAPIELLYSVAAGMDVPFSLTVRYTGSGHAAVHVRAEAVDTAGNPVWGRRGSLYSLIRDGRALVSPANPHILERRMLDHEVRTKRMSADQIEKKRRELRRVDARIEARAPRFREFSESEQQLNRMVGAIDRPEGRRVRANDASDMIRVRGNVQWTDENGDRHPLFGAEVAIMDEDDDWDEHITSVITDIDGNYSVLVDNDDDPFSDRDIYVEVRAENHLVDTQTEDDNTWIMSSDVYDETPDGSVLDISFVAGNSGTASVFSVFQAATWIAGYAQLVNGSSLDRVEVIWPCDEDKTHYNSFSENINVTHGDRWDWDTVHHEYGHYVMDKFDTEDNPGGDHSIGDCIAVTGDHNKDSGVRMAWAEGWSTFFALSGQRMLNMAALNVPRVGDERYQDFEDGELSYSIEAQTSAGEGEDNELAVQRALWDLFDDSDDGRDTISMSDETIWDLINVAEPTTFSAAWQAIAAGRSTTTRLKMGAVAADHAIGPSITAPTEGAVIEGGGQNFSFNRNVGCSVFFAGDLLDVTFYDGASLDPILTVPVPVTLDTGETTSFSLTDQMFETLAAAPGNTVIWSPSAYSMRLPITGPYRGDSARIIINRPPVADAGTDKTAECESSGRTGVALSATGSSDPDGDTLTYKWSAPGVSFDDATSATPVGNFPIGTHTVTLEVSDGYSTDTDEVQVTVTDTTPPVISCPIDVQAECTGNMGVDRDDPQLAAFFASVSATDTCDDTPVITHDAPERLPVGVTPVTFTATDSHGNVSTCVANITVVDTQLPSISVTLDHVTLWPPNHKFVTINAAVTVTDLCDPNPTFRLISITSSDDPVRTKESDDIAGAEFGTADTTFQLRAERIANGAPRRYTIVYRGLDSSMNWKDTTVYVDVPHDQRRQ